MDMRTLAGLWAVAGLTMVGLGSTYLEAIAQAPGPGIGFRNDLKTAVIVQGVSVVSNTQRRGQPFVVQPGKTVWDSNLLVGMRIYTIYDGNQQRILLRDRNVRVQNADQYFVIRPVSGNPGQVKMDQEPVPTP